MATICPLQIIGLIFIIAGRIEAENSAKESNGTSKPFLEVDKTKISSGRRDPLVSQQELQRKKRMTPNEDEVDEAGGPAAYLRVLSGDEEKRGKSSFRGDLGKRMQTMSRGISGESSQLQAIPFSWFQGKRLKASSRFRGDLGKRGRSSFRGDLGKRRDSFSTSIDVLDDDLPQFLVGDSIDNNKYGGDQ